MVKELKKKYIMTTMLVATLLLVVFLAAVNGINFYLTRNGDSQKLEQIVEANLRSIPGGIPDGSVDPEGQKKPEPEGKQEPFANRGLSLGRYFVARISSDGEVLFHDLSHDADLSFDEMVELVDQADISFLPEGTGETGTSQDTPEPRVKRGSTGGYLYHAALQPDGSAACAFLDISQEKESLVRLILVTAVLGAVLWILIFLLVLFLSEKAIVPIAVSIEKQRQFITNAGHEIKTPLAVIISNVDVQELHGGKTRWLDNIRTQALRLSDLTKQMLTLAKMEESGTAAFTSTTFDASATLEEAVRDFLESASLRGIDVKTEIEAGVSVHFPKEQFQQMVKLLLDNAIKYGKQDGFLSVRLRADKRMLRMSFSNDCDELPDIDPDRLFDRFYRPDSSRSRQSGGSGIGLAVVRAIAKTGGGSAKANFLPDQVIEFEIEIPRGNTAKN